MCFYLLLAVGEPPLCMSCASLFAVKHAVEEARNEIGKRKRIFCNEQVYFIRLFSAIT